LASTRLLPKLQHDPRRASEGIPAPVHRRRPCVVGRAEELDAEAEEPSDRRDDSEVLAALLEDGPLLDMELEIGANPFDPARLGEAVEVEARARHCVSDAAAAPVVEV